MSDSPRTIVIVGGVAGGASAATRARRIDENAEIILLEKDAHISFANCGLPYYLGGEIEEREKLLVAGPELFARRFRIDVRTGHEVTAIDRPAHAVAGVDRATGESFRQRYDKLILATGAAPIVPPIEGAGAAGVFTLRNLADTDRIHAALEADRPGPVVVVGAGFIGLEMAEQLVRRGRAVTVVEMIDQVLAPLDPDMAAPLAHELRDHGVDLRLGAGLEKIEADAQGRVERVRLAGGAMVPAALVILGVGVRPLSKLAKEAGLALEASGAVTVDRWMRTSDPAIYAVGDACAYRHGVTGEPAAIPLGGPANRAGRVAGGHAAAGDGAEGAMPSMGPVYGTAIVRVFGQTAAITGLSEKAAAKAGIEARAAWIEAGHHAGYFPGARPLHLKLVYRPDGRLLGAQAVGEAGVDKRIDVLATALAFGATIDQLAGLDLAYAPPYGAAKDPVHQAAFTAQNDLAGLAPLAPPDAPLDEAQVVDVRTGREWEAGHLPGAIHVPVDDLRQRLDELDPARPTVVVCESGRRAHVAARLLTGHGFADVRNLAGGMALQRSLGRKSDPSREPAE